MIINNIYNKYYIFTLTLSSALKKKVNAICNFATQGWDLMPQIPLMFPPSRDFMPAKRKLIFRGRHSAPLGRLRPSGRKNFMSEIGFIFSRHRNKWTFRYFNENNCRNICTIQKNVVPLHQRCKTRKRKRFKEEKKHNLLKSLSVWSGNGQRSRRYFKFWVPSSPPLQVRLQYRVAWREKFTIHNSQFTINN